MRRIPVTEMLKLSERSALKILDISPASIRHRVRSAFRSPKLYIIMLFPVALLLELLAGHVSYFSDIYYNAVYSRISVVFNQISGVVPYSIGELLLVLAVLFMMCCIIVLVYRLIRKRGRRLRYFFRFVVNCMCAASVIYFLFVTNCGINYYRSDYTSLSGAERKPVSALQLYETGKYLAENASKLRSELSEDENGVMKLRKDPSESCADAVNALSEKYPVAGGYSIPKKVIFGRGMSYCNTSGVYFPWTFEANVNSDIPDYSIPETMCHELSHVRGFMQEQDANFIAFLACVSSSDRELQYSGTMLALVNTMNALYSADSENKYDLWQYISDGVRRDMKANSEYWKQFETPVAETAVRINDSYLKSNAQPDGVRSYGAMVDLVVAYYYSLAESETGNS